MISMLIDTIKIDAPPGTTVLEAARQAGIAIPTLCYLKALRPNQSCRLCIVEIDRPDGPPRVATSCDLLVGEGMVVTTNSPQLSRLRAMIIELLLAGMPDNQAIKELADKHGVIAGRFESAPKQSCVLCGICIQACREKIGVAALRFSATEGSSAAKVAEYVTIDRDRCLGCGTCANLCPVGTIAIEDRGDQRSLFLYGKEVNTLTLLACRSCGAPFITDKMVEHLQGRLQKDALCLNTEYCPMCARQNNPAPLFERAAV